MQRRVFLAGAGTPLAVTLAGCPESFSGDGSGGRPQDDDPTGGFLREDERPESAGAEEFLVTVEEVTDELARFKRESDTRRIGFSEDGDTWEIRCRGAPHAGDAGFREELAESSTAFASHRPDGVSLEARFLHGCTTGDWQVRAGVAAAYEGEEPDRQPFVDRVHERAETVNNC